MESRRRTGAELGDDVEQATAVLGAAWARQEGDGPIAELEAATQAVVKAVRRLAGPVPPKLVKACAGAEAALARRGDMRTVLVPDLGED